MTSSKPNYLPKATPPNTTTSGIKASMYESGGFPGAQRVKNLLAVQKTQV